MWSDPIIICPGYCFYREITMGHEFPFNCILDISKYDCTGLSKYVIQKNINKKISVPIFCGGIEIIDFSIHNLMPHVGVNSVYQRRILHSVIVPKINTFPII